MAHLRLSIGSALALGLRRGKVKEPPTTVYIMVGDRCTSDCLFCTQGRSSPLNDRLSRVTWPHVQEESLLEALGGASDKGFRRICLQVLMDPVDLRSLPDLIGRIHSASSLPISVSISPVPRPYMERMKEQGADSIGIALDGCCEDVFDRVKGACAGNAYTYEGHWRAIGEALDVFGPWKVSTHLIIGMGEKDKDVFDSLLECRNKGVTPSLFAFTQVVEREGVGDPPPIGRYRAMQVLRHMLFDLGASEDSVSFDASGRLTGLDWSILGEMRGVFVTRGCLGCNRPYYNERPSGPLYNHPFEPGDDVLATCMDDAREYVTGVLEGEPKT
ncbi:MAG: radical SAM protein [Candidatus Thermoplasmatota archaeon]|nr:radical SAM protein [Candidatus Thermoplasmatota archaeon]